MKITGNNENIDSLKSWEDAFLKSSNKWKDDRSACSLAKYFTEPNIESSKGLQKLTEILKTVGYNDVEYIEAEVEHESKFDKYRNGRKHDLMINAKNGDGSICICIEAKVDESFGKTVASEFKSAKETLNNNPESNSKKLPRLIKLLKKYYNEDCSNYNSLDSCDYTQIRYQLLHALAGTIAEAKDPIKLAVMPIFVFHTDDIKENTAKKNKQDYINFMESLGFDKTETSDKLITYRKNVDGVDVISFYVDIDMKKNND